MGRQLVLFLFLVGMLLLATGGAAAQGPSPQHSDTVWQAYYWTNPNLTGDPQVQTVADRINFNWGTGGPGGGIPADNFSARWTRTVDLAAGRYRFTATSDDGIRVWVDGTLVIDQWT